MALGDVFTEDDLANHAGRCTVCGAGLSEDHDFEAHVAADEADDATWD